MPAAPPPPASRPVFWVVVLTLLHCGAWFLHYGDTPLGESPALDNRQTLLLAQQMAADDLPAEPFHRAPLYPWLLSLFLSAGIPFEAMPWVGRLLNALALAAAAGATARAAGSLWKHPAPPWIAGLLVGLNPVLLFFAGDPFDILLATAALCLCLPPLLSWLEHTSPRTSLGIGVLLALGAALRSHLMPLALAWPLLAAALGRRRRILHFAGAALPVLTGFLLLGWANLQIAGEFRVLPWQGSYNLWAGNKPEASGRIYAQAVRVEFDGAYDNPAKLESIALYEQETGKNPPHSVAEMNAHWKSRFIRHVTENPLQWLGLMTRKAYFFLNSYEQYDNKTYGFHQQRHAQLRFNPIHWGALLLLAVAAVLTGLRDPAKKRSLLILTGLFAVYAAGTILFYTSNRFRLPMIPVLALLAPGVLYLPAAWREARAVWRATLVLCLLLTAGIAYSGFFDARDTATWEEDYALLANAALRTGRDAEAIEWAGQALERSPGRTDMRSLLVQARFNQWALSDPPRHLAADEAGTLLEQALTAGADDPDLMPIVGIYHWKLGERAEALTLWRQTAGTDPFARLCLVWTGKADPPTPTEMELYGDHRHLVLLREALGADPDGQLSRTLDVVFSPATGTETRIAR